MTEDDASVELLADRLERLVDATDGIDRWCSGPDWTISTHEGFAPSAEPFVLGDALRWAAPLARYPLEDGATALAGLEPMWGFSCPTLLPDPGVHAAELALALRHTVGWTRLVLTGYAADSDLYRNVLARLGALGDVYTGPGISRCVADISDGADAWLGRRSASFRRAVRRTRRRTQAAGVTIEQVSAAAGLMDRLLAIEAQSWKGAAGDGLLGPGMTQTYRRMIDRLAERERLRAVIAVRDGEDLGFMVGGVRAGIYRGLQIAYVQQAADLSIGHLLQTTQIDSLDEDVHTYDMGMDIPYKRRFADRVIDTTVIVVERPQMGSAVRGR